MTVVVCRSSGGGVVMGRCSCSVLYQSRKSGVGLWCTNERIVGVARLNCALTATSNGNGGGLCSGTGQHRGGGRASGGGEIDEHAGESY
jgi:hypothetical protein